MVAALTQSTARADKVDDLLLQAKGLVEKGRLDEARAVVNKAIDTDPKNVKGYFFRAGLSELQRKYGEALTDYDKILSLDPKIAEAYNLRGGTHFKLGHIKESIADFDRFIGLRPKEKNGHWMRGISLYYAGRFEDGRKQFEGYETVDTNDVENAVWHFLCMARSAGVEKARKSLLKIGKDERIPMMEVYALFQGKAKPEDVLAAAKKVPKGSAPGLLRQQLFYAHLYLGLYFEATGDPKRSLDHIQKAATDYVVGHYMGEVARVHLAIRNKAK
jgi:lipoprotein NlpI